MCRSRLTPNRSEMLEDLIVPPETAVMPGTTTGPRRIRHRSLATRLHARWNPSAEGEEIHIRMDMGIGDIAIF